jgi:hypothetical protein
LNNQIGKPIDYFLLNNDFVNVMRQLHAHPDKQETVSYSVGASLSLALPASSAPGNKKNGLQTASAASAGSVPKEAAGATRSNDIPTCSDTDSTICNYLDSAFPSYRIVNTTDNTFIPCTLLTDYDKFPAFKTSYRNTKYENVCYTSGRPDWEPYNWFFFQIRWSHDDSNSTYSFSELAIAAHILTGGATSPGQDLYTKTKCINLAFKRYFQNSKTTI